MTSGAVNGQPNNFISSSDAASLTGAPVDSFMVYVGAGVDGPTVFSPTNPVLYSDGHVDTVYDKQRRWFDEVAPLGPRSEQRLRRTPARFTIAS